MRDPLYLIDFVIVSVSLGIEAYFYSQDEEELAAGLVGLLVFGRAWRFLRIIYSLFLVLHEVDESILHKHEKHHEVIEQKIHLLEEQLKQWEIEQEAASPRTAFTINQSPHTSKGQVPEINSADVDGDYLLVGSRMMEASDDLVANGRSSIPHPTDQKI